MPNRIHWPETLLPALTLTLGMQMLRTIGPYLRDLLSDRLQWPTKLIALALLLVFASAFLTGWLNNRLGIRRLLLLAVSGVGLTRLTMQFWSGDPVGDMFLAALGVVCFSYFLPTYLAVIRSRHPDNATALSHFALGLLVGLTLDTALHGAFLTYDLIWQSGLIPLGLTIVLVTMQGEALNATLHAFLAVTQETDFKESLPWLAVGPFLALQALIFQNPARLAVVTEWLLPYSFGWILFSQVLAIWLVTYWPQPSRRSIGLLGGVLVICLLPMGSLPPWAEALALLGSQITAAFLLTAIITALNGPGNRPGLTQTGLVHSLGMLLMVAVMAFFYSLYLNLPLPFERGWPLSLAGLMIAGCAILTRPQPNSSIDKPTSWLAAIISLPLLLLPVFVWLTWQIPVAISPQANAAIRVMTYNVHNGFNTQGHMDLITQSQVIAAQQPDIVALQEVSRGSLVNGTADMLSWFSQQLGLPYVFTPAGDGLWGQAILSRYPIQLAQTQRLSPPEVRRTFGYFKIDAGWSQPLSLINTHYQPRFGTHEIQKIHTEHLLNFLAQQASEQTIILGDLNAEPDMPQMQPFFERGFIDVIDQAGLTPGNTASSVNPVSRIDYILISPDLQASQVVIPASTAADHLSVAATINQE
jgi:endonuclease/exonuclease/phosphatase family metal-dependent hydrolase